MTAGELRGRVTLDTCAAVVALAAPAVWIGGTAGGLGVLAGGALAVVNFRWLVARVTAVTAPGRVAAGDADAAASAWLVGSGLRFGACLGAGAFLLATGWAHPIGLLVGFTVLPGALVARGLAAARAER
jgi:hypothetical protein